MAGRTIVLNSNNDPEKDKDMVQNLLGKFSQQNILLTYCSLETTMANSSDPDQTLQICSVWSGSELFANCLAIFL